MTIEEIIEYCFNRIKEYEIEQYEDSDEFKSGLLEGYNDMLNILKDHQLACDKSQSIRAEFIYPVIGSENE